MLTALSTLSAQPKSDPARASAPRPGATIAGNNAFASLIRRQAGQPLDAPSPADQAALAAPVSAAPTTPMPRPVGEHLASRPTTPGQAPAEPGPALPSPSRPPWPSAGAGAAVADTTATDTAGGDNTQPSPAPTPPHHGEAVGAAPLAASKAPGTASRPDKLRSLAARSGQADSLAANRSPRERKPGTTPGVEVSAETAPTSAAGLTPTLAQTGPTSVVGNGAEAPAQDPGAAPQPAPGLPPDLTALPAVQAPATTGAPAGTGLEKAAGTGQIGPGMTQARLPASTSAVASAVGRAAGSAEVKRPTSGPAPAQTLDKDLAPAIAIPGSPAPTHGRSASLPWLGADPKGHGADTAVEAIDAPARQFSQVSEAAPEGPLERRQRSPGGPDALSVAQRNEAAAAAQSGAWRPGPTPAAGDNPAAPAASHPANQRASPGMDRAGPEPRHAAGPATLANLAAAALSTAQAQPDGAAPRGFDNALQAALTQGPAQPGTVAGPERSGEPPRAMQIDAPVDSPLFAPALGSQLSLLARDGVRSALLQLHPAEMGPISVEIALDGNAARIDFQALRADTRSLIEASLPALAGALQDAGLTLAGGGVFEQAPGRQPQAQAEPRLGVRPPELAGSGPAGPHDTAQPARRAAPRGLVDLVA